MAEAIKLFEPNEHLIKLKGKDYLQVMWRLVWFRAERPNWCIDTELVSHEGNSAVFCSKIRDENGVLKASGYGSETKTDFNDYLEKAETKAIGRGLAMLGYGTQFAPDLDEGERIVDSPVDRKSPPPASKARESKGAPEGAPAKSQTNFVCASCGKIIEPYEDKRNGNIICPEDLARRSLIKYETLLCVDCAKKRDATQALKHED